MVEGWNDSNLAYDGGDAGSIGNGLDKEYALKRRSWGEELGK